MSGPGRYVCWSAAARPRDRHTRASLGVVDLEARPGPAAADQHRGQVLRTLRLPPHRRCLCRLEARPGPATAHGHRIRALRTLRLPPHRWRLACWRVDRRVVSKPSYGRQSASSHVVLLSLIQILNLHRWNCNVFEVCRKMTAINYVRDLPGGGIVIARVAPHPSSLVLPVASTPV